MSVRIGRPVALLMRARMRKPSASPGPRYEATEVRFALSYEALKMNGTRSFSQTSARRSAMVAAWASFSITHGPATTKSGAPAPSSMLPIEKRCEAVLKCPSCDCDAPAYAGSPPFSTFELGEDVRSANRIGAASYSGSPPRNSRDSALVSDAQAATVRPECTLDTRHAKTYFGDR